MKKLFSYITCSALLIGAASVAEATIMVEDFDSYTGNLSSIVTADYTLTSNSSTFDISNAPWNSSALLNYWTGGDTFTVEFNSIIDFFSIDVGDYNADVDNVSLSVYDSSWNLLGSDSYVNPAPSYDAHTLSVSTGNIAYAVFADADPYAGAVYWDNMTYNTVSVPEPTTLGLLGLGLLGMFSARRRKA